MLSKKTINYILITAVILGIFFSPFLVNIAKGSGATQNDWNAKPAEVSTPNLWTLLSDPATAVVNLVYQFIYYVPFKIASAFLYFSSFILSQSVTLSITGSTFSSLLSDPTSAVNVGWGLCRDIVNLFLIFILLYIAIATILQVSGYGAKELLVSLIVIAFLVNFSLVITKLVVDASNILAVEFYNSLAAGSSSSTTVNVADSFIEGLNIELNCFRCGHLAFFPKFV